jgi:putative N6-adenine-specific DNA methylase
MKKTAFEKRIKRRIIAKEHTFFASCAPGLKRLLADEILNLNIESKSIILKKGGVEFFGRLHDCYLANLYLRCPIRILMRVAKFKAENFTTLEKRLTECDWELLLQKNAKLNFHVSTKKSRLYHTSAIAQRADTIISSKLLMHDNIPPRTRDDISHDIFIRAEKDRFEISLDSSGDLLHKRGIKEMTHHAPLRENLAWALLLFTQFSKNDVLIDPMCGTGTFSLEAAMYKQNIPPGFFRNFAFQSWQCFRKKKWRYLIQQAKKKFEPGITKEIFASDIDNKAISSFKKNILKHDLNKNIEIKEIDFFFIKPEKFTKKKGVIVLNPPYGKRIGNKQEVSSFYNEIGKKLKHDFKGWRAGIIMPEKNLLKNYNFQKSAIRSFYHGGLDIFLLTGII